MVQFDGAFAMEYSSRVARKRVLFENSIVCLVVLFLLLFFGRVLAPRVGTWFFDASFWCLFAGLDCSDSNSAGFVPGFLFGEFDPGSGRTLAACLTHASRTERLPSGSTRVANG